jgi:hypothetical protein
MLLRHRQTKGPETDRLNLNHRATFLLYQRLQYFPNIKRLTSLDAKSCNASG